MSYLVRGALCLLATPLIAQATPVDDVGCFIQRNVDKADVSEELSAVVKLQAMIESVKKAKGELRSLIREEFMVDHPKRRIQAKRARKAHIPARNVSRREAGGNSPAGPNSASEAVEVVDAAVKQMASVRAAVAAAAATGSKKSGWELVCGHSMKKEQLGGWGIFTLCMDAFFFGLAFFPEARCLPLLTLIWYVFGLMTLRCDQGLSIGDSMLTLAQMATTVGYGSSTANSTALRLFHGVHGVLVGQGIDEAMGSVWDYPMDAWDNCVFKRIARWSQDKWLSEDSNADVNADKKIRERLRLDLIAKTVDLLFGIAGASLYFAHDLKKHWTGDDGDEKFSGKDNEGKVVPNAIYTALISMTSIGYGDIFPKGTASKVMSPFILHPLVKYFARYSDALLKYNTLDKFRTNVEPPSLPEPWNIFTCPLRGIRTKTRDPNMLPEKFRNRISCEEPDEQVGLPPPPDSDDSQQRRDSTASLGHGNVPLPPVISNQHSHLAGILDPEQSVSYDRGIDKVGVSYVE